MRILNTMLIVAVGVTGLATAPVAARDKYRYYDGRNYYSSYEECERRRDKAGKRGTVIGAVGAGAGTAVLGGNLGASLLGAGVGAIAGNQIGRGTEKKCSRQRYNGNRGYNRH